MEIYLILPNVDNLLGPGRRLCIWTAGCSKNCKGCASPHLREFNKYNDLDIVDYLKDFDFSTVDGITISGGEPFLQIKELRNFIEFVHDKVDDILIYTGMKYDTLKYLEDAKYIFSKISVLVDGEYVQELDRNDKLRGSNNQKIIIFKNKYKEIYEKYNKEKRSQGLFDVDGKIIGVGLLRKGD